MRQQVNLFQSEFKKKREFLSLETLFISAIGLIVVLGVMYWSSATKTGELVSELKELESKVAERTAEISKLSQSSKNKNPTAVVDNSIEGLKKYLELKQLRVQELRNMQESDSSGFSRYFESFSRNVMDGLWLTEFSITDSGSDFEIKGNASEAKLVLGFVEKLSKDVMFSEYNFSTLEVVSGDIDSPGVSFVVNTGGKY